MRKSITAGILGVFLGILGSTATIAQENDFLEVGAMAPDIEVVGATRYGILREPVRLSDYRGETVVLAFFFRARTRG